MFNQNQHYKEMKKLILPLLSIFLLGTVFSQEQNPYKNTNLYIAFQPFLWNQNLEIHENLENQDKTLNELLKTFDIELIPALLLEEEQYNRLSREAVKRVGDDSSLLKLKFLFRVKLKEDYPERLITIGKAFEKISGFRYYSIMSEHPVRPPFDIPPVTSNYLSRQKYLDGDGVQMRGVWNMGLNGQGVNLRDVEYGFNKNHEELNEVNVFVAPGMTIHPNVSVEYSEHGTATLGVLYAHHGDYGVSGMAHGANEAILFPEYTTELGYDRVYAVLKSIEASAPGDIILYEMQTISEEDPGNEDPYVPAEYDYPVWDLTKAATDAGIIVVAAAGNGNINLDAPYYREYMERGNSGAIIVGAGSPDVFHSRLSFSTYGSRIDLHGWGYDVLTSGYGNYIKVGGDFNQGYTLFSGTSSATPVVASCVAVLQSFYMEQTGEILTGAMARDILQRTGTPQGTLVQGNIGPIPNMPAAIDYLQSFLLSADQPVEKLFNPIVFPVPFDKEMTVRIPEGAGALSLLIYDSYGTLVSNEKISHTITVDTELFSSGIYFLCLENEHYRSVKKVVKL